MNAHTESRQLQEYKSVYLNTEEEKEFKDLIKNYDMNSVDNVSYHLGHFSTAAESPSWNELLVFEWHLLPFLWERRSSEMGLVSSQLIFLVE